MARRCRGPGFGPTSPASSKASRIQSANALERRGTQKGAATAAQARAKPHAYKFPAVMHHSIQLCVQMRARAPPPQRSHRREVREDPGRLLDESFFWELRPEGARVKVDGYPAQFRDPGKHQRREL